MKRKSGNENERAFFQKHVCSRTDLEAKGEGEEENESCFYLVKLWGDDDIVPDQEQKRRGRFEGRC